MKVNEYGKQFFLYAKGWYYKSENIWDDLLKLYAMHHFVAEDCHYKPEIFHKVTKCALECVMNNSRDRSISLIQKLLEELSPNHWLRGFNNEDYVYKYEEEVLNLCFSIMSIETIENLNPEKDCDFNVLPKRKNKTQDF